MSLVRLQVRDLLLVLLALGLVLLFGALGTWQLQRRAWKLDLIERVERQLGQAPVPAPAPEDWASVGKDQAYLPVVVSGHFLHQRETLVQAMTSHGSGYWVLTPLRSERGFIVLVNRGFVDAAHREPASRQHGQTQSPVQVSGLLRLTEPGGRFLQPNDAAAERWYSRDVHAIGRARGLAGPELAPYFIDVAATGSPGGWPVPGLTVVQFRNAHLGYALTWYGLALMSAAAAGLALRMGRSVEGCRSDGSER